MCEKQIRKPVKTKLDRTHFLVVFLEEVKLFLQAVQIPSQGGNDLLVVGLGLFQGDTVALHGLTHHQLRLPPGKVQINREHGGKHNTLFTLHEGLMKLHR